MERKINFEIPEGNNIQELSERDNVLEETNPKEDIKDFDKTINKIKFERMSLLEKLRYYWNSANEFSGDFLDDTGPF